MVSYKCNRCDKIFTHKHDYERHTQRKNPCPQKTVPENTFYCNNCGKAYDSIAKLNKHIQQTCSKNKILEDPEKEDQVANYDNDIIKCHNTDLIVSPTQIFTP